MKKSLFILLLSLFMSGLAESKEYSLNVCIRELDLKTGLMGRDIETDDGKFKWFVVCGLLKNEIENNNSPGTLVNGQADVSAGFKVGMKCYKSERRKSREILNYGKNCIIASKLNEINNNQEIYKINPGLKK